MRQLLMPLLFAPAVAYAQAAPATPTPDVAKLTFAWPTPTRARVETQRYRERHTGDKHDTTAIRMSYRMTADREGTDYVIRFDDFQLPDANPGATGVTATATALIERLGALVPSYRVSGEGEFTRLEAVEAIRAFMDSMFAPLLAKDGPPPPQLKQLLATMTSDEVLSSSAAQEWNALVGTWVGAELEVGEAYVTSGEEPVPIFQGANIHFDYEFSALRRMSCDSVTAPAARDCVELQMVSKPDSAAMRQFLQRFMSSIVPDAAGVGFTNFDVENVVTLVARPESLLPVFLVVSKEVTGTMRAEGKEEQLYQLDVRTAKYTYVKQGP
ncbi:MAG: hypothetical protein ACT4PJ_08815 [Gemmatimonadaceae bacterium]